MIQRTTHLIIFLSIVFFLSSCQKRETAQQALNQDSLALVRQLANDLTSSAKDPDILFVFSDSSGHYLIGGEADSLTREPYYLATSSGDTIRLKYIGYRKENEYSTHRQVAANFQNEGGHLFYAESGSLRPDQTYMVVTRRFLEKHHPIKLTEINYSPVDHATNERISRARARSVSQSWRVATLGSVGEIALVLFEQNATKPLAGLVVVKDSPLIFEDYVGDASDEGSVWRVDDGGQFDARSIHIIAAFQAADGIELARTWAGSEGENEAFLRQSFNRFVPVIEDFRYWAVE